MSPLLRHSYMAQNHSYSRDHPSILPAVNSMSVSLLSFGLPYLKPSWLLRLPLIMPVAIFNRVSTAPLPPFPKLLQPFSSVKLIWTLLQPMTLLSLVPKPAMTLFLSTLSTVIICSPLSSSKIFSSATPPLPQPLPLPCFRRV